jgi:L-2-hydroxyglutarate oxidase LhgO
LDYIALSFGSAFYERGRALLAVFVFMTLFNLLPITKMSTLSPILDDFKESPETKKVSPEENDTVKYDPNMVKVRIQAIEKKEALMDDRLPDFEVFYEEDGQEKK